MAGLDTELLQQLSENIEKIRELGLSKGLNNHEIDYCIELVAAAPNKPRTSRRTSNFRRFLRVLFKVGLVVFSLLVILFLISTVHPPTDRVISQILSPLSYPFFRILRLGSLPISKRYDLTKYYDMQCLLSNPYYEEEPPDCGACDQVTEVIILQNVTEAKFLRHFVEHHQYRPAVVQGEMTKDIIFSDLRSLFVQHLQRMGPYVGAVNSNSPSIKTPKDLFVSTSENQIKEDKNFYSEWISKQMGTAQVLRELFKRPSFLPKEGEISLEKTVIVENTNCEKHSLPREGMFPYVWYSQASGARNYVLSPHPACQEKCKTLQVKLYPGEMLFYLEQYWKVESYPITDDTNSFDGISVACHGYFM